MSLDRLLGTWSYSMQHVQMTTPVTGEFCFERVLAGAFVMMHSTCSHPDFPDAIGLLDDTTYSTFDVRGVRRVFDLVVDDVGWSTIRRDEDFWQRSSVRFVGDDAMEGTGENSHDQGSTWDHDYAIALRRA